MKLVEWKKSESLTDQQIASLVSQELGRPIGRETVRRHVKGDVIPTKLEMQAYHKISDGLIDANSFYDLPCDQGGEHSYAQPP